MTGLSCCSLCSLDVGEVSLSITFILGVTFGFSLVIAKIVSISLLLLLSSVFFGGHHHYPISYFRNRSFQRFLNLALPASCPQSYSSNNFFFTVAILFLQS